MGKAAIAPEIRPIFDEMLSGGAVRQCSVRSINSDNATANLFSAVAMPILWLRIGTLNLSGGSRRARREFKNNPIHNSIDKIMLIPP
jgi:hypothetical protein